MDDLPPHPALLPAGLRDLLPPDAQTEAASVETVMRIFASHGYERVKPPLLEFEDTLLAGSGAAVSDQVFRIMDPDSHRMMGLRADMTPQIARIAATRLAGSARPLRLAYEGACIRVRTQRDSDRQVPQAGIEIFGADSAQADAEVMLVGAEALASIGLSRLSLDLTLPTLTPALLDAAGVSGAERQRLARALDRKDAAEVAAHGGSIAPMLGDLLLAAGPAPQALEALARAPLPAATRAMAERLASVVGLLQAGLQSIAPSVRITIDPLEFRGFRYHTGIAVSVFAAGRHEELGRGGRYLTAEGEPATGLTLYADAVLRAAPKPPAGSRLFLPFGTAAETAALFRAQGFATIASLDAGEDPAAAARRLGCSHLLVGSQAMEIGA
jgi:ATP phosphoribosyltransferase regulatory subunit